MEWLKNNILNLIAIILLALVLCNQYQIKKEITDVKSKIAAVQNEVNGIDNKLDYMESDINQIDN